MKKLFIYTLLILTYSSCFSQTEIPDTLIIESQTIKIIKSDWGARFNLGISKYSYGTKTSEWLGNHYGPNLNLTVLYKNFRFGFGFKPWTVNPNSELVFDGDTLTTFANLNPIKFELTIGYNFKDLQYVTLEPYVGYLSNSFTVINEDVLKKKFDIPSQSGFTIGLTVYKNLFEFNPYDNLQIYLNLNYNLIDFSKVNSALDKNYFAFELGLSFQGWLKHTEIVE